MSSIHPSGVQAAWKGSFLRLNLRSSGSPWVLQRQGHHTHSWEKSANAHWHKKRKSRCSGFKREYVVWRGWDVLGVGELGEVEGVQAIHVLSTSSKQQIQAHRR